MQYMKLNSDQREEFLDSLGSMPAFLRSVFHDLSTEQIRSSGPDGTFSPVEQVWHLADLEREGFGERIRRLLTETDPHLPDFDGAATAIERNYCSLSFEDGLVTFTETRRKNIEALRGVSADSWLRSGIQAGVGTISLCDIPGFMSQHDSAHRTRSRSG